MSKKKDLVTKSPLAKLQGHTSARIALGNAGGSLPTEAHLRFQLDHARARDAVHSSLDLPKLAADITALGLEPVFLTSGAGTRDEYLRNPNLGRRLSSESSRAWKGKAKSGAKYEILVAIGDGLSPRAIEKNGVDLLKAIAELLGIKIAKQVPIIQRARVAIGDEVASIADAKVLLLLIGERPGLSSSENISVYLTYEPKVGTNDAARNCISNIGGTGGLTIEEGAKKAVYLANRALKEKISGIALKDEQ